MQYKYEVKYEASYHIWSFYRNVARKYRHTFVTEDIVANARRAIRAMNQIEKTLLRRKPTIRRWQNYHMAHSGHWYYAYTIDGDTITIHDACHERNMHEDD